MSNPQKENGFTAIANEILESLVGFRIPGECRQVFDHIIRKTYGFNKKVDIISISQFQLATGMRQPNICRAINKLVKHCLIIKSDNKYSIRKDYSQWIAFGKGVDNHAETVNNQDKKLSKVIIPIIKSDNKSLSKVIDTKDSKDNTTKDNNKGPIKIGDILNTKYRKK